jgi:hypothetical protein
LTGEACDDFLRKKDSIEGVEAAEEGSCLLLFYVEGLITFAFVAMSVQQWLVLVTEVEKGVLSFYFCTFTQKRIYENGCSGPPFLDLLQRLSRFLKNSIFSEAMTCKLNSFSSAV